MVIMIVKSVGGLVPSDGFGPAWPESPGFGFGLPGFWPAISRAKAKAREANKPGLGFGLSHGLIPNKAGHRSTPVGQ